MNQLDYELMQELRLEYNIDEMVEAYQEEKEKEEDDEDNT